MNIKFSISKILNVRRIMLKKDRQGTYGVSVITILQLPYLSHELLLEGETKVRSWAHNGQDGGTHCYHSFRGSMPTQLDWVAANTAALVSDIIALRPFHFLKEHPPGKDCRNRFTIAMAESSVRRVNTARFLFPSPHHDLFVIFNYLIAWL